MIDVRKVNFELLNDEELKQVLVNAEQIADSVRAIENEDQINELANDIRSQIAMGLPVQIIQVDSTVRTCNQSGDTIQCNVLNKILACAYEVGCQPNFSSECTKSKFTIRGCDIVTFS
ncbi:MAG: hypothetical protein ACOXZH_04270 [Bacteroidales bacterium]|jgi:hypothetical protein